MKEMTIVVDEGIARQLAFIERREGVSPSNFICETIRPELLKFIKEIRLFDKMLASEEEQRKSEEQAKTEKNK